MARTKAADEVFCRSCGEAIKEIAEICPECGVRNEHAAQSRSPSASTSTPTPQKHDPAEYETTVSETWYYGIAAGVGIWVLLIMISGVTESIGAADPLLGVLVIAGWVLIPVATYYDAKYVRANSTWNPNTVAWCLAGSIWFVNIMSALFYLYRRHETLGEP